MQTVLRSSFEVIYNRELRNYYLSEMLDKGNKSKLS